ncbi:MAG: dTMP kinase [Fimbriimonadales bacterium]
MRGRFITLEGPEGAGKSTLAKSLAEMMRTRGIDVLQTREPGDGPTGPAIRQALLQGGDLDHWTELFLFLADRSQHCEQLIGPALHKGDWVLCDRFADSTVVYQGHARGLNIEQLRELNQMATRGLEPHLTLLLDIDPVEGLARIQDKDRLDREPIEFHARVRAGFLKEAERDPERWRVLDASLCQAELLDEAWYHVHQLIGMVRS